MNIYSKSTAKPYPFVVNDTTPASDNTLQFIRILKRESCSCWKDQTWKNPIQDHRAAAKTFALSSGKINKHEYITAEEILPSEQSKIIEQDKVTQYFFGKLLKTQVKK